MSHSHHGPGETVRRVNAQMVVLLGWGRAILLQIAHPLVAAGVSQHSDYASGVRAYLRRTHGTVGSMLRLTFGTADDVRQTADHINAIHRRVHGQLRESTGRYPAGTWYTATDPELLTWVHATLVESQLLAYELFVAPLAAPARDRYCAEAALVAPLLGIPEGHLPTSVAALASYLQARFADGTVEVTRSARRLADDLLYPGGALGRPLLGLGRLVTAGLLPPALRAAYGLPWNERRQRRLDRIAAVSRATHRVLPSLAREWPAARRTAAAPSPP